MGSAECREAPATDVVGPGSTAPPQPPTSVTGDRRPGWRRQLWWRGQVLWRGQLWRTGLAVLVALTAALTLLPAAPVSALPWLRGAPADSQVGVPSAGSNLQEIAPPLGVQQLKPLLEAHQPRLRIVSPQADSLVPAGPWTLQLELSDWPLQAPGAEGLGPHLVVQLDEAPPLRLTTTSVEMPPLAPGSHRLSVIAAMPWGEAMRNPGAFAQIRLHRTAANPLAGPAPGTPQLIPLLPTVVSAHQPLPLDWILLDAPLQHLRDGDDSWRLRVSLDGDVLLLDHQEALWLRGLSPGRHPLLLELVNTRGEPLNPPYNSLVHELVTSAEGPAPPWLAGPLSASELARLSGTTPPPATAPTTAPPMAAAGGEAASSQRLRDQEQPAAQDVLALPPQGSPGPTVQLGAGADRQSSGFSRASTPRQAAADALPSDATSDTALPQPEVQGSSAALVHQSADGPSEPGASPDPGRTHQSLTAQPELGRPPLASSSQRNDSSDSLDSPGASAEPGASARNGLAHESTQPSSPLSARPNALDGDLPPRSERGPTGLEGSFSTPSPEDSMVGAGTAPDSIQFSADGLKARANGATSSPNSAASPRSLVSASNGGLIELRAEGPLPPDSSRSSQAQRLMPPDPRSMPPDVSAGNAPPAASPTVAEPLERLGASLSVERPASPIPVEIKGSALLEESQAFAPPAQPLPPSAGPSTRSSPRERGAGPIDPHLADPGRVPVGSSRSGADAATAANRPSSSRSVTGTAHRPSLSPPSSPPEPFDPWSTSLMADPSARQGVDRSRSDQGGGPLQRLLRLVRR